MRPWIKCWRLRRRSEKHIGKPRQNNKSPTASYNVRHAYWPPFCWSRTHNPGGQRRASTSVSEQDDTQVGEENCPIQQLWYGRLRWPSPIIFAVFSWQPLPSAFLHMSYISQPSSWMTTGSFFCWPWPDAVLGFFAALRLELLLPVDLDELKEYPLLLYLYVTSLVPQIFFSVICIPLRIW